MVKEYGEGIEEELEALDGERKQFKAYELEELIEELKLKIDTTA